MVIADDDRIDGRYLEVHQGILSLLALQAPVAGDLRLVAALLHVIKHVERMGDQCVNIAKMVPLAGHEPPDDDELLGNIARMGELAASLVVQCKQAFERRDAALAQDLVRQDDEIDRLNKCCFARALDIGDDPDTREWAMHMMLVARAIERMGDNAVDIGEQTAFVATGPVPRVRGRLAPRAPPRPPRGSDVAAVPHPNHEGFFPLFARGRAQRRGRHHAAGPADARLARRQRQPRSDQGAGGGGRPDHPRHPAPAALDHGHADRPRGHPRAGRPRWTTWST